MVTNSHPVTSARPTNATLYKEIGHLPGEVTEKLKPADNQTELTHPDMPHHAGINALARQ